MCVVLENTSSTRFGRIFFNTNPALYCCELLGFHLKTQRVASSCGRLQCGPVGGLRRVDGSGLLFTEFTTVLSESVRLQVRLVSKFEIILCGNQVGYSQNFLHHCGF